jgi:hypothetical protein
MKRVLRSCIEPLPRFLTTRGLAVLVLLLVAGMAISVREYMQTGGPLRAAAPRSARVGSGPQGVRSTFVPHAARCQADTTVLDSRAPAPFNPSAAGEGSAPAARPATMFAPTGEVSGT